MMELLSYYWNDVFIAEIYVHIMYNMYDILIP